MMLETIYITKRTSLKDQDMGFSHNLWDYLMEINIMIKNVLHSLFSRSSSQKCVGQ